MGGALAGYHTSGTWGGAFIGGFTGLTVGGVAGFATPWAVGYTGEAGALAATATVLGASTLSGGVGSVAADRTVQITLGGDPEYLSDFATGSLVGLVAAVPEATAVGLATAYGVEFSVAGGAALSTNTALLGTAGTVATTCNTQGICGPFPVTSPDKNGSPSSEASVQTDVGPQTTSNSNKGK